MKFRLTLLGLLYFMSLQGQVDKNIYLQKIIEICPNPQIIKIESKQEVTVVEYLCQNILTEVGFNNNNKISYRQTQIIISNDILNIIEKKIKKKYDTWKINKMSYYQLDDTTLYKFEIIKNNIVENLYFTLDGKYFKAKDINSNETWNISNLNESDYYKKANYKFLSPQKIYEMPEILKEISGISIDCNRYIYSVQDNIGAIFKYDLKNENLSKMIRFTDLGDFEDIAIKEDTAYILRSDGTIFWLNHRNFNGKYKKTTLPLNCLNIEGLFIEKNTDLFLISCKDQLINGDTNKRIVYSFSKKDMITLDVFLEIDIEDIKTYIANLYPEFEKTEIEFNPSAIAIHPISKEIYVLSANERMLAIYENGKISKLYPLPAEIYYKPEGLDFSENGDLYISSEGIKKGFLEGEIFYLKRIE